MDLYIVESGEYDEREIEKIFTTEHDAEVFIASEYDKDSDTVYKYTKHTVNDENEENKDKVIYYGVSGVGHHSKVIKELSTIYNDNLREIILIKRFFSSLKPIEPTITPRLVNDFFTEYTFTIPLSIKPDINYTYGREFELRHLRTDNKYEIESEILEAYIQLFNQYHEKQNKINEMKELIEKNNGDVVIISKSEYDKFMWELSKAAPFIKNIEKE